MSRLTGGRFRAPRGVFFGRGGFRRRLEDDDEDEYVNYSPSFDEQGDQSQLDDQEDEVEDEEEEVDEVEETEEDDYADEEAEGDEDEEEVSFQVITSIKRWSQITSYLRGSLEGNPFLIHKLFVTVKRSTNRRAPSQWIVPRFRFCRR
jgi:hypothetical protein